MPPSDSIDQTIDNLGTEILHTTEERTHFAKKTNVLHENQLLQKVEQAPACISACTRMFFIIAVAILVTISVFLIAYFVLDVQSMWSRTLTAVGTAFAATFFCFVESTVVRRSSHFQSAFLVGYYPFLCGIVLCLVGTAVSNLLASIGLLNLSMNLLACPLAFLYFENASRYVRYLAVSTFCTSCKQPVTRTASGIQVPEPYSGCFMSARYCGPLMIAMAAVVIQGILVVAYLVIDLESRWSDALATLGFTFVAAWIYFVALTAIECSEFSETALCLFFGWVTLCSFWLRSTIGPMFLLHFGLNILGTILAFIYFEYLHRWLGRPFVPNVCPLCNQTVKGRASAHDVMDADGVVEAAGHLVV